MEFRVLGPLEVRDRNGELALGRGKQRALLAVLLIHAGDVVDDLSADRSRGPFEAPDMSVLGAAETESRRRDGGDAGDRRGQAS